jgi:hypothetical protein
MAAFPQVSGAPVPRIWRSQDVVNAIGVNTHLIYGGSGYTNTQAVLQALQWLGLNNVREGVPISQPNDPRLQPYKILLGAGVKMTMVAPPDNPPNAGFPSVMAAISATLQRLVAAYPGQITGVEGLNEPDLQNDGYIFKYKALSGAAAVAQYQIDLYATIKGVPSTAGIPVWEFSLNSPPYNQLMYESVYSANKAVLAAFDLANRGVYPGTWSPEWGLRGTLTNCLDVAFNGKTFSSGPYTPQLTNRPMVTKELGLTSSATQPNKMGLPDYVTQAKILPSTLYDALITGATHADIYELADVFADPTMTIVNNHFGLYDNSFKPKPVATVLHNTIARLTDTSSNATTFTPTTLNVSIYQFPLFSPGTAGTGSGYSLISQQANGTYNVLVWYEPLLWNNATNQPLPAPAPVPIKMYLSATCKTSSVYDPLTDTTVAGPSNASQIPVALPDHPVLVSCVSPH